MRTFILIGALVLGVAAAPPPAGAAGVRMFVRHDVADYATWRKNYDAIDATRRNMGVTAQAVYQSTDNPNDVTAYHDFKSIEQAKAFAASAELKAAMQKAGVSGAPQIWFTTKAVR
jgi:quinol monooxygenase YgiN